MSQCLPLELLSFSELAPDQEAGFEEAAKMLGTDVEVSIVGFAVDATPNKLDCVCVVVLPRSKLDLCVTAALGASLLAGVSADLEKTLVKGVDFGACAATASISD